MKPGLASREQRLLLVGLLLVGAGLWLYTAYVLLPLIRESRALGERVRGSRAQLKQLETSMAGEVALREQHRRLTQAVTAFRALLPSDEEVPKVLERISSLASQAQVKIQTVFPRRPADVVDDARSKKRKKGTEAPTVYFREIFIEIDALAGFHQIGTLVNLIESEERPMQVAGLRISADAKDPRHHHVKLSIRTYVAPPRPALGGPL
jgi:Tfp pilus assembly protein PilO